MNRWLADALITAPAETCLFLDRGEVVTTLQAVDVVETVRAALLDHGAGRTILPGEAYLSWANDQGAYTRSIGMPGAVRDAYGMKIINSSVSNPLLGIERAGGLGLCFDPQTARVAAVMEVGVLSAVRTAAVSTLGIEAVGYADPTAVAVIGCGTQARVHLALLLSRSVSITHVTLHDARTGNAQALAAMLRERHPGLTVTVTDSARQAMAAAEVVLFLTTVTDPYVPGDWVPTGSLLVNVSLGDLTDEVLLGADALYVDDIDLIAENPRRPLGRLLNEGRLGVAASPDQPGITATIGEALARRERPKRAAGYVVLNPFGLGVLDVALFAAVWRQARKTGAGRALRLV